MIRTGKKREKMEELYYKNKKNMFLLVFPIFIEQLLNATIGIADTMMVSSSGDAGVSGVSNIDVISTLLVRVFSAFATGATVVIAQCIGAGDKDRARRTARQSMLLITLVALTISTLFLIGGRGFIELIYGEKNPAVTDYAVPYFMICACSYPFMAIFQTASGIMRATGKSTPPMIVAFLMNLINVGGNAVFIYLFKMETKGAALATLISRIFAAFAVVILLISPKREINIRGIFPPRLERSILKAIFFISLPTAAEHALFNLGKIIVQAFVNGYGEAEIAANAISNNIFSITIIAAQTMNLATTTVVGYCVGKGFIEESKKYTVKFAVADAVCMLGLNLIILPLMGPLLKLYEVTPEAVGSARIIILTMLAVTPFIHPLAFNIGYSLRAAGDVKYTMTVAAVSMFFVRVALGYVFGTVLGLGALGTWLSMYADWVVRAAFYTPRIWARHRKIKNLARD